MTKTIDISDTENEDWLRKMRKKKEAAGESEPETPADELAALEEKEKEKEKKETKRAPFAGVLDSAVQGLVPPKK